MLTDFRTTQPWSTTSILPLVCSLDFMPGLLSVFYPQSSVCILPLVCSLYFTPGLQSVFYPWSQSQFYLWSAVCILPMVYSLCFTPYTYFKFKIKLYGISFLFC